MGMWLGFGMCKVEGEVIGGGSDMKHGSEIEVLMLLNHVVKAITY